MNDYMFIVDVSNNDGSNVRRKCVVATAENVETALAKVKNQVSDAYDKYRGLVDVKKI